MHFKLIQNGSVWLRLEYLYKVIIKRYLNSNGANDLCQLINQRIKVKDNWIFLLHLMIDKAFFLNIKIHISII